jgi:hypothetical protein
MFEPFEPMLAIMSLILVESNLLILTLNHDLFTTETGVLDVIKNVKQREEFPHK